MVKDFIRFSLLFCSCIILALTASCGGGGGGDGGDTAVATTPSVVFTIPSNYQNSVATNRAIAVTFNTPMTDATLNAVTFFLAGPAGPVPGTVSCSDRTATFTPLVPLTGNATYRATITTGARSQAGIPLAANVTWKFATGAVADNTAPSIAAITPVDPDPAIALNTLVSATFSEPVLAESITTATFTLKNGLVLIPGTVSFDGAKTATFSPSLPLLPGTTYTATVTNGVTDLAGNSMGVSSTWDFTTGAPSDVIPPTVTVTSPVANDSNVPVTSAVTATFGILTEKMNPASINVQTFILNGAAGALTGTVAYDSPTNRATFTPDSQLAANTVYTATITTGATDMAGNPLAAPITWSFTTGADATSPTVKSTIPANGAAGVPLANPTIAVTFSEAMNPAFITNATYILEREIAAGVFVLVGGTITLNGATAELVPPGGTLLPASTYRVTVTTGAQDMAGNPLLANFTWTFTTQ